MPGSRPTLRVSIGVLAHDEEERIAATLDSILAQDLLCAEHHVEVVVVANGCTDATVARAEQALAEVSREHVTTRVVDDPVPGKARAWNRFVHELSDREVDYLILADGDIELTGTHVLTSLVETLERDAHAIVSTDRPVKDVVAHGGGGALGRLSALASQVTGNHPEEGGPTWICGQLYCGRAEALRTVMLPDGTMCDDAYVYTMITTQNLTQDEDPHRVVLAPAASHVFEAYLAPARVLRHQRWILVGKEVNAMVYQDLAAAGRDAGEVVRERNEQDPGWLEELVRRRGEELDTTSATVSASTQRLRGLRGRRGASTLALAPVALGAGLVDAALTWSAHRELRTTGGRQFWQSSGGWGKREEPS